jgi:hypothetical protein
LVTQLWPCDVLRYARYPCPLLAGQSLLAAASPAPGLLHSAFPGSRPNFPVATRFPSASLYASRLPGLRGGPLQFSFPGCSSAGILGLHATPVLYGRTEPPGRLPSCARPPHRGHSRRWADFPGRYPVSTVQPLSSRLLASRGPLCTWLRGCSSAAGWVCLQPLSISARQCPLAALPSCARSPRHGVSSPGCGRISPVLPGSHRPSILLTAPGLAWASVIVTRSTAPRPVQVYRLPLPISARQSPLTAVLPRQAPNVPSLFPGRRLVFPHIAVPPGRFFPLTVPGLTWATPRFLRNRGTAACQVCRLPLSITAGQSPLAAFPPAPGSQLLSFPSWLGLAYQAASALHSPYGSRV